MARDIRRAAVRTPLRREDGKPRGQWPEVRPNRSRVDAGTPGMKQHERIAVAMLLVPCRSPSITGPDYIPIDCRTQGNLSLPCRHTHFLL